MSGATPLFFGPAERPLFGWVHSPTAPADLGLVLCNPFGYEAICAHGSIRQFAEAAARANIPALRFDYDGTGNSAGEPLDDSRLAAWVAGVGHAIDALRKHAGVERVALLGIRLGATIAALAASGRNDVAAMIAIAPVVNAKAYLRELRMLQITMDSQRGIERGERDGPLESCGFLLSSSTQEELKALDLIRLNGTVPAEVLIIERTGFAGNEQWPQSLRDRGARVERCELDGYAEMMLDSHKSVVPEAMIQKVTAWLAPMRDRPVAGALLPTCEAIRPHAVATLENGVLESAVRFGIDKHLFGVVSSVANDTRTPGERRAILLLTAGAVHHIGPNRAYVSLARDWALKGHLVLRMDIGGTGDSDPRSGSLQQIVYSPEVIRDVASAIDYLRESWGATRFEAVGICSGAYHALKSAAAGLPLASITLINPLTFRWREGLSLEYPEHRVTADIARYRSNIFRPSSWAKLLGGGVDLRQLFQVLLRRLAGYAGELASGIGHVLRVPMRDNLGSELVRIAQRGVGLQFVFATEEPGIELLRAKGGIAARRLRSKGLLRVHMIEGADHTFTDRGPRETLLKFLSTRLDGDPP